MTKNSKFNILILSGLFTAAIFIATYVFKFPMLGGYYHLGDALIYIATFFIPCPIAGICGALGEGLSDLLSGYVIFTPFTIVSKFLLVGLWGRFLCTTQNRLKQNIVVAIFGIFTTIGWYALAEWIILKNIATVIYYAGFDLIQSTLSSIIFILFTLYIQKRTHHKI